MGHSQSNITPVKYENNINYISNNSSVNSNASQTNQGKPLYSSNFQQISSSTSNKQAKDEQQQINTSFKWKFGGQNVCVTGSFTLWKNHVPLQRITNNEYQIIIRLPPGVHIYKFLVDGEWKFSPDDQTVADENGNINNIIDTSHTHQQQPTAQTQQQPQFTNPQQKQKQSKPRSSATQQANNYQTDAKQQTQQQPKSPKIPGEKEWAHQAPMLPSAYQSVPFLEFKELKTRMFNEKQYQNKNLIKQLDVFDESNKLQPPSHVVFNHCALRSVPSQSDYNILVISHRFKAKSATIKFYTSKYSDYKKKSRLNTKNSPNQYN